ncbi:hypothetical protein [Hanstruepera marina]|uniref:hypothetical protein n=1 Tax=Hanstruepera marina TaxID=2873265 RepID=UPI001CA6E430|nr:hypothetical protein [Hanstruepera marina]
MVPSSKLFSFIGILIVAFFCVNNQVFAQENDIQESISIPEPLMFDLVRGLGAKKGELEINALADFPINNISSREVEWAPEVEYAVFNGFAVELELPFENFELEAIKMAIQWTIGQSKNNKYIHGIQVIGETMLHDNITEFSFLYVPGYRFNETWSTLGLFGLMLEVGSDAPEKKETILLNASIFADINEHMVLGLELNNTDPTLQGLDDNEMSLLVLPQLHYEFESGLAFQIGFGPRFEDSEIDASAVLRVIKTF